MCQGEKGDHIVIQKFACRRCKENIGETVEQGEKLCDEVEAVREFIYLGDRGSAGGGCEAAVTITT